MRKYCWAGMLYWAHGSMWQKIRFILEGLLVCLLTTFFFSSIIYFAVSTNNGRERLFEFFNIIIVCGGLFWNYSRYMFYLRNSRATQVMYHQGVDRTWNFMNILASIQDVEQQYAVFKKTKNVRDLEWNDLLFHSVYSTGEHRFWNAVNALLDNDHPQHYAYYVQAGCPDLSDKEQMYAILQHWYNHRNKMIFLEKQEECTVYFS